MLLSLWLVMVPFLSHLRELTSLNQSKEQSKNSVGAGDSMVAGFTGEFVKSKDAVEAFKWGVACGTATTFSDDLATAEFIKETYGKVEVEKR